MTIVRYAGMGEWGERREDERGKAEMELFAEGVLGEETCTGVLTHGVECTMKDERNLDLRNSQKWCP